MKALAISRLIILICFHNSKFFPLEISVSPTIFVAVKDFMGRFIYFPPDLFEFYEEFSLNNHFFWALKHSEKIGIENGFTHF